jgi:hypothetical protein
MAPGIENETAAIATISQSAVTSNTAASRNGGNVSNQNSTSGSVSITNSIIAGQHGPRGRMRQLRDAELRKHI